MMDHDKRLRRSRRGVSEPRVGAAWKGLLLLALILCCAAAAHFFSGDTGVGPSPNSAERLGLEEGSSRSRRAVGADEGSLAERAADPRAEAAASAQPLWRRALTWLGLVNAPEKSKNPDAARNANAGRTGPRLGDWDGKRTSDGAHLSIAGRVLGESGLPVAGIELTARAAALFDPDDEDRDSGQQQAWTDSQGWFGFEGLPEGEYRIRTAAVDGFDSAQAVVRTGTRSVNLVLGEKRQATVYGVATSAQEGPLEGAWVTPEGQPARAVQTGRDGRYRLRIETADRRRTHTLRFSLEGYRDRALLLSESEIAEQGNVRLDVQLEPVRLTVEVSGKVADSSGQPVVGETVYLSGPVLHQALTDQYGEFVLSEVEANADYRLWMRPGDGYRDIARKVRVGPENLWTDLVLDPLEHGALSGRMADVNGFPVPFFSLWLESAGAAGRSRVAVTADEFGRFSVPEAPLGYLSFKTLSDPRIVISGLRLPPGGRENVSLTLDWGGHQMGGRVLDAQGNPVPAAQVILSWSAREDGVSSRSLRRTNTAADGSFRFFQLGPGLHVLSVDAPGFQETRLEHLVGEGLPELEVRLQQTGRLKAEGRTGE